jgi:hypothetical protein
MGTGSAATSAIFQANCADLSGVSADGVTRISWLIMALSRSSKFF